MICIPRANSLSGCQLDMRWLWFNWLYVLFPPAVVKVIGCGVCTLPKWPANEAQLGEMTPTKLTGGCRRHFYSDYHFIEKDSQKDFCLCLMMSVTCHLIETKRLKIHWGNIGAMWIIITLMTHAHMECNLKAIMGSVTFLIQSSTESRRRVSCCITWTGGKWKH